MAKLDFSFLNKYFLKLKKIKHIEVYALIILVIAILAILFWPAGSKNSTQSTSVSSGNITTTLEYAKMLESRLNSVLSQISGAGDTSCMITLDGEIERVLAYADDQKNSSTENTTSNGSTNKTETSNESREPIIITVNGKSEPLVIKEIMPNVKGVVVVASGADNIKVKLDILKAVQALLKVDSSAVEIFCKSK